jgi:hypothetical protein
LSPKNKNSKFKAFTQLKDWQKATLLGILMGAFLGLGIAIPLKILFKSKSSQASTIDQQSNLPMSFYFIADSGIGVSNWKNHALSETDLTRGCHPIWRNTIRVGRNTVRIKSSKSVWYRTLANR